MKKVILITIIAVLAFAIGCSGAGNSPISPVEQPLLQPQPQHISDGSGYGHILFGYMNVKYETDSNKFIVTENRTVMFHANVKPYILPPNCNDCIKFALKNVDPWTSTYTFGITLKNPTGLSAYDIRGIVILDPAKNHQLMNADGYTPLWDDGPQPLINPFKAFATDQPNRIFGALTSHKADFELYVPLKDFNINFAVDASWPGNCREPYEIIPPDPAPKFDKEGKLSVDVDIIVRDWQNDIEQVVIDASALGYTTPIPASPIGGDVFRATNNNF